MLIGLPPENYPPARGLLQVRGERGVFSGVAGNTVKNPSPQKGIVTHYDPDVEVEACNFQSLLCVF